MDETALHCTRNPFPELQRAPASHVIDPRGLVLFLCPFANALHCSDDGHLTEPTTEDDDVLDVVWMDVVPASPAVDTICFGAVRIVPSLFIHRTPFNLG